MAHHLYPHRKTPLMRSDIQFRYTGYIAHYNNNSHTHGKTGSEYRLSLPCFYISSFQQAGQKLERSAIPLLLDRKSLPLLQKALQDLPVNVPEYDKEALLFSTEIDGLGFGYAGDLGVVGEDIPLTPFAIPGVSSSAFMAFVSPAVIDFLHTYSPAKHLIEFNKGFYVQPSTQYHVQSPIVGLSSAWGVLCDDQRRIFLSDETTIAVHPELKNMTTIISDDAVERFILNIASPNANTSGEWADLDEETYVLKKMRAHTLPFFDPYGDDFGQTIILPAQDQETGRIAAIDQDSDMRVIPMIRHELPRSTTRRLKPF